MAEKAWNNCQNWSSKFSLIPKAVLLLKSMQIPLHFNIVMVFWMSHPGQAMGSRALINTKLGVSYKDIL